MTKTIYSSLKVSTELIKHILQINSIYLMQVIIKIDIHTIYWVVPRAILCSCGFKCLVVLVLKKTQSTIKFGARAVIYSGESGREEQFGKHQRGCSASEII